MLLHAQVQTMLQCFKMFHAPYLETLNVVAHKMSRNIIYIALQWHISISFFFLCSKMLDVSKYLKVLEF